MATNEELNKILDEVSNSPATKSNQPKKIQEGEDVTPTIRSSDPASPPIPTDAKINEARRELEISKINLEKKRIEKEEAKLEAGTSNSDPWSKILEMQANNFNQILQMREQNFSTQLELERIKLMKSDDGGEMKMYLEMLAPHLPQIITALKNPSLPTPKESTGRSSPPSHSSAASVNTPFQQGVKTPAKRSLSKEEKMNKKIEAYKKKIREGKITEEQGFEDFKKFLPTHAAGITKEGFHDMFEKIKAGTL